MKNKSKEKKLTLNKISIAWLDKDSINHAKGGAGAILESLDGPICPTEHPPQCYNTGELC